MALNCLAPTFHPQILAKKVYSKNATKTIQGSTCNFWQSFSRDLPLILTPKFSSHFLFCSKSFQHLSLLSNGDEKCVFAEPSRTSNSNSNLSIAVSVLLGDFLYLGFSSSFKFRPPALSFNDNLSECLGYFKIFLIGSDGI